MKKSCLCMGILILAAAVLAAGCQNNGVDDIIPSLTTDTEESTLSDTDIGTEEDTQVPGDTTGAYYDPDTGEYSVPAAQEETYELVKQSVINSLFSIRNDIDRIYKERGYTRDTFEILSAYLDGYLDGKNQTEQLPYVDMGRNMFNTGEFFARVGNLFDRYQDQAIREDGLLEILRIVSRIIQDDTFSVEEALKNELAFHAVFDGAAELVQSTAEDGTVTLSYADYDGKIMMVEGNRPVLWLSHLDGMVYDKEVKISGGYSGNVTVAPVNAYGAVGRSSVVYIENTTGASSENTITILGDEVFIGEVTQIDSEIWNSDAEATHSLDYFVDILKKYPNLHYLTMERTGIEYTKLLFDNIPAGRLKGLYLHKNKLAGQVDLSSFTMLDMLDLSENNVEILRISENVKTMTELNLSDTQITDLSFLENIEHIGNLRIDRTQATDFSPLSGKEITHLFVSVSDMTKGIEALGEITGLQSLDISGEGELPQEVLDVIKTINSLGEVYYNGKPISIK